MLAKIINPVSLLHLINPYSLRMWREHMVQVDWKVKWLLCQSCFIDDTKAGVPTASLLKLEEVQILRDVCFL